MCVFSVFKNFVSIDKCCEHMLNISWPVMQQNVYNNNFLGGNKMPWHITAIIVIFLLRITLKATFWGNIISNIVNNDQQDFSYYCSLHPIYLPLYIPFLTCYAFDNNSVLCFWLLAYLSQSKGKQLVRGISLTIYGKNYNRKLSNPEKGHWVSK